MVIRAVDSAIPSIRPTVNVLAPSTDTRNTGSRLWIISDEISANMLTKPSAQMLPGIARSPFGRCCAPLARSIVVDTSAKLPIIVNWLPTMIAATSVRDCYANFKIETRLHRINCFVSEHATKNGPAGR